MTGPVMSRRMVRSGSNGAKAAIQVVVLHGSVSPDGKLSHTEVLASTDASLNQAALNQASATSGRIFFGEQPGATPTSREIVATYEFVTAQ